MGVRFQEGRRVILEMTERVPLGVVLLVPETIVGYVIKLPDV